MITPAESQPDDRRGGVDKSSEGRFEVGLVVQFEGQTGKGVSMRHHRRLPSKVFTR